LEISEIAQTLYPFMGSEYVKPQDFLIALLDSVSNDDEATFSVFLMITYEDFTMVLDH